MNGLFEAAVEVQSFLRERGWLFCIIGGVAVARWGEPRATQDVDITLLTGLGREEEFIRPLLDRFEGRRTDTEAFAVVSRVVLLRASNGVPVDVALAGFPCEEHVVTRATPFDAAPGVQLITCSAEDLVVLKSFAARDQDWVDVRGILVRQGGKLDWRYIQEQLGILCELKEEPEILDRLARLRREAEAD